MSNDQGNPPQNPPGGESGASSQQFSHTSVSARVPERIAKGVMSTGIIVLDSPSEFIVDFLQALTRPPQVAARVILVPGVMEQFILALRDNIAKYEQVFGPIPPRPRPMVDPQQHRPTIQEIYDELKIPDEQLSGVYANAMMIGHSPSEFFIDFITRFYPTSSVSCRIYLSALQVPSVLDTLSKSLIQYRQRYLGEAPPAQNPPQNPPPQNPPAAQS
jgi:hypothetical protein